MAFLLILSNRLSKLIGNITKVFISYPFHFLLPNKRFTIPVYSKALFKGKDQKIQKNIWQTNYSNKVSLPIYLNYLLRLLTLKHFGGIYMDIDAHLIFPLSGIIKSKDKELFILKGTNNDHTNYFIATEKNHPILSNAIDIILDNINSNKVIGVFSLTGPVPFSDAITQRKQPINDKSYRHVCVQGSFTNEHFQYIDKPKGKWTHKKPEEILKPKG